MRRRAVSLTAALVLGSVALTACPPPPQPLPPHCRVDRKALETAIAAHRAVHGELPADATALLEWIDAAVFASYTYVNGGDGTYALEPVGDCVV